MSAPNLEAIFNFEDVFEPAIANMLATHGIPQPAIQRGTGDLKTPFATVSMAMGAATPAKYQVPVNGDLVAMPASYHSTVTIDITTNRNDLAQGITHTLLRARCRIAMADFQRNFAGILQYHDVEDIREGNSTQSIQSDRDLDTSSITFAVDFRIRQDAWPATF